MGWCNRFFFSVVLVAGPLAEQCLEEKLVISSVLMLAHDDTCLVGCLSVPLCTLESMGQIFCFLSQTFRFPSARECFLMEHYSLCICK